MPFAGVVADSRVSGLPKAKMSRAHGMSRFARVPDAPVVSSDAGATSVCASVSGLSGRVAAGSRSLVGVCVQGLWHMRWSAHRLEGMHESVGEVIEEGMEDGVGEGMEKGR